MRFWGCDRTSRVRSANRDRIDYPVYRLWNRGAFFLMSPGRILLIFRMLSKRSHLTKYYNNVFNLSRRYIEYAEKLLIFLPRLSKIYCPNLELWSCAAITIHVGTSGSSWDWSLVQVLQLSRVTLGFIRIQESSKRLK